MFLGIRYFNHVMEKKKRNFMKNVASKMIICNEINNTTVILNLARPLNPSKHAYTVNIDIQYNRKIFI